MHANQTSTNLTLTFKVSVIHANLRYTLTTAKKTEGVGAPRECWRSAAPDPRG